MCRAVLLTTTFLLLLAGCAYFRPGGVEVIPGEQRENGTAFTSKRAYIFVDGKRRGVTPATVRVRRSFGTLEVSLHTGPKFALLRKYEIQWTTTASRVMADYTFGNEDRVFDAQDLDKTKDGSYIIPYYASPIAVEDREYDLVIIVMD